MSVYPKVLAYPFGAIVENVFWGLLPIHFEEK
jgi:hypothetical protein